MIKTYVNIFILVLLIASCDPCDDCDAIFFEPTISLVFIDQERLDLLQTERTEVQSIIDGLDGELDYIDSILNYLNNRITELNIRIDAGEDLENEKGPAEDSVRNFTAQRESPQENKEDQESILDSLNTDISTINSGDIFVNSIEIIETGSVLSYPDSATSFSVPLSMDTSFLNYAVTIGDETNTFVVDYELFQEVDADRNVLIRARDIELMITNDSFDSLVSCQENCLDGQATFTLFF